MEVRYYKIHQLAQVSIVMAGLSVSTAQRKNVRMPYLQRH
jgi:hypothetical protein